MNLTLPQLAQRLGGEVSRDQVLAPGPGHSPKDRSLAVKPSDQNQDGFVVHSFANDDPIACKDYVREKARLPRGKSNGPSNVVAKYDYHDETGTLLFRVERLVPKKFRQCRPNGNGGWDWSLGDTRRVIYRLPEIAEAVALEQPIFIAEGEKAVDALVSIGLQATCSPGGACKWRDEYAKSLAGADVVILPDNDEPGELHAKFASNSLRGVASSVRMLRLPDLPDKGDPFDWIATGGTADQLWQLLATGPAC